MADVFRKAIEKRAIDATLIDYPATMAPPAVLILEGCDHQVPAVGLALERFKAGELIHCLECSRDKTKEIWRSQRAPAPEVSPDVLDCAIELLATVCVCGENDGYHAGKHGACERDGCTCPKFRPAPLRAVLAAEDAVVVPIARADLEVILGRLMNETTGYTEAGIILGDFISTLREAADAFDQERARQEDQDHEESLADSVRP